MHSFRAHMLCTRRYCASSSCGWAGGDHNVWEVHVHWANQTAKYQLAYLYRITHTHLQCLKQRKGEPSPLECLDWKPNPGFQYFGSTFTSSGPIWRHFTLKQEYNSHYLKGNILFLQLQFIHISYLFCICKIKFSCYNISGAIYICSPIYVA